ncbi:thioredoxin family protein [Natronomonas sp.]|uniref:thioredoxin family protein n=1 Tax=Natronomonas sp. TaxID=2184060 RepID=UPI002FC35480
MSETTRPERLEDGDDLDRFIEDNDLALVEFYSLGCPKCQAMEPIIGNVARATDAAVGMLNPRDDLSVMDRFDISSTPTLILFKNGEQVGKRAGGVEGTEALVEFVEAA